LLHLGVVRAAGNERRRKRDVLELRPAAEGKRAGLLVERLDLAGGPSGRRVEDAVARRKVVLLRREGERPDERVGGADRLTRPLESADRLGVALLQLLARPPDLVEERPPDG